MSKSYQKEYRENMPDEQKQKYREKQREANKRYRDNMSDEQKQKLKDYQKKYRDNMTDEQKQKKREADKRYKANMTDEQKQKKRESDKRYRDNMSDEWKQKLKDYQKDYLKKYYAVKKLNNKITNDKIIDDNDFYCISIIIKLKKYIVPIKDINSILKINKKVCSQAYLEGCNFINDSDNKND